MRTLDILLNRRFNFVRFFNPSSLKSDQHQISPCKINALWNSGHENYEHDHTRWICLILYQLSHYVRRKWIGATNENSNSDLRVQSVKNCISPTGEPLVESAYQRREEDKWRLFGSWTVAKKLSAGWISCSLVACALLYCTLLKNVMSKHTCCGAQSLEVYRWDWNYNLSLEVGGKSLLHGGRI